MGQVSLVMTPVHFDMETADPDDVLTLLFLLGHPEIALVGLSVTPGRADQIKLLDYLLHKFSAPLDIALSYGNRKFHRSGVSGVYYKHYPEAKEWQPRREWSSDVAGVLKGVHSKHPDLCILTGAPLTNIAAYMKEATLPLKRWIAQGGFAGDNIVEPEHRLEKFSGLLTCSTFNFGGDIPSAEFLLSTPLIQYRRLLSKNICHGTVYSKEFRSAFSRLSGLSETHQAIFDFLEKQYISKGNYEKKIHDLVAAVALTNPDICGYRKVELYCEKGKWGSKENQASNTEISVNIDLDKFQKTFIGLLR